MAIDPFELNILGANQLITSKLNKVEDGVLEQEEGVQSEHEDEFTLKLSDDELLNLAKLWTVNYAAYEKKIEPRQKANRAWYLGQQEKQGTEPISSNLLFEAEETFLPAALSKNPEPVCWSDNTDEGDKLATDVKTMLQYHADTLVFRRKLTLMVRHWSVYFLGIIKHGWDDEIQEITSEVRLPSNFILDPNGYVDAYGDFIGYLGERITVTGSRLIELFPKEKDYITIMCDGHLGTDVVYTEWWEDKYCFYTFKDRVLEKNKNPHFNQPKKKISVNTLTNEPEITEEKGHNHFARAKKPYTFLSVYSFGDQPHDVTSLIEQNIPNQRRISRRTDQIDTNLSRQNNSTVFSENNFTQETAKQASTALAKGHPVLVPQGGPIGEAIHKIPADGVPAPFFTELETSKNDLRSIFGTAGITATDDNKNDTARGMILKTQYDNSRIGGGIGDALEQVADNVFNWWVQLYHVYYDEPHFASILGQMKATEYITLSSESFNKRVIVSVSPDSMKPHDEVTEMNQAMELYRDQVLDPKTLLTRLNFPDAQTTAEQSVLWQVDKNAYIQLNFPQLAQQLQQMQMQQQQAQQQMQQQQMAQQDATVGQQLGHKEAAHQQKMSHNEQAFTQKQKQSSLSENAPSASLKNVPLPK